MSLSDVTTLFPDADGAFARFFEAIGCWEQRAGEWVWLDGSVH